MNPNHLTRREQHRSSRGSNSSTNATIRSFNSRIDSALGSVANSYNTSVHGFSSRVNDDIRSNPSRMANSGISNTYIPSFASRVNNDLRSSVAASFGTSHGGFVSLVYNDIKSNGSQMSKGKELVSKGRSAYVHGSSRVIDETKSNVARSSHLASPRKHVHKEATSGRTVSYSDYATSNVYVGSGKGPQTSDGGNGSVLLMIFIFCVVFLWLLKVYLRNIFAGK